MKFALTILAAVTLLACSPQSTSIMSITPSAGDAPSPAPTPVPPPAPAPAPTPVPDPGPVSTTPTFLWVMVVDGYGICVVGATVQVIGGQGVGPRITQETPCGYWEYGGGVIFRDLIPGVPMTIRAESPGYSEEQTVAPKSGPQTAHVFWATPTQ